MENKCISMDLEECKHQFKAKDVFGPRFEKNFMQTFDTVFSVPSADDKARSLTPITRKYTTFAEKSTQSRQVVAGKHCDECRITRRVHC